MTIAAIKAERLVRASLWLTAPLNLGVALVLAFPASAPGRLLGLPGVVDPVYAGLSALMVALFGLAYAWLALQPRLDRPVLYLGAIGKAGVFVLAALLWLAHAASGAIALVASGDLALACLWLWWLRSTATLVDRGFSGG